MKMAMKIAKKFKIDPRASTSMLDRIRAKAHFGEECNPRLEVQLFKARQVSAKYEDAVSFKVLGIAHNECPRLKSLDVEWALSVLSESQAFANEASVDKLA